MALLGKEVTFVDLNAFHGIEDMRDRKVAVQILLSQQQIQVSLNLRIIESEIGSINLQRNDLEEGTFDLITFVDLVGKEPKGEPEKWLFKAKVLLKEDGYLVIDEREKTVNGNTILDHFNAIFPQAVRISDQAYQGDYYEYNQLNFPSKNGFYKIGGLFPPLDSESTPPADGTAARGTSADSSLRPADSLKIDPPTSDTGGIDFRALPIVTQAIGNLRMSMDTQAISRLRGTDVSRELEDLQRMVDAGIAPSSERIKEYVQASSMQGNLDIDKVIICISDILRREEETCCPTEPVLRDILVVLESSRNNQELSEVFVGKI